MVPSYMNNEVNKPKRSPKVYNRRRAGVPEDAVDISRTSPWGNPFHIGAFRSREKSIEEYRDYVQSCPEWVEYVQAELRGKDLLCWCKPKPCHGDVLIEIANRDPLI